MPQTSRPIPTAPEMPTNLSPLANVDLSVHGLVAHDPFRLLEAFLLADRHRAIQRPS